MLRSSHEFIEQTCCSFRSNTLEYRVRIYEIPIHLDNGRKEIYIGMTKRKFVERLKEHRSDIKTHKQSTALSIFYRNNIGCRVVFENSKVIIPFNAVQRCLIRESIELC